MRLLSVSTDRCAYRRYYTRVVGVFLFRGVARKRVSLRSDLEHRAQVLCPRASLATSERSWNHGSDKDRRLQLFVQRFGNREHLLGVAIYDRNGELVAITPDLRQTLMQSPAPVAQAIVAQAITDEHENGAFVRMPTDRRCTFSRRQFGTRTKL